MLNLRLKKKQLETQVSIRMPKAFDRYRFIIDDQNHPSFSAFGCLAPDKLGSLLEETNFLFTHAQFDPEYPEWFTEHKATTGALEKQRKIVFGCAPKFSINVPLYNTPIPFFNDMAESVKNQSYANWELVLVNASPDYQELKDRVEQETTNDNRIKSISLTENKGISENTNNVKNNSIRSINQLICISNCAVNIGASTGPYRPITKPHCRSQSNTMSSAIKAKASLSIEAL